MRFFLLFLVFGLIASSVLVAGSNSESESKEKKKCKKVKKIKKDKPCPVFKPTGMLNNALVLDSIQDKLFEDLWDAETPKLTKQGNKFKDIIFDMRESGISEFESYALAVTLWSWAYLPQMARDPDLSGYLNLTLAEPNFLLPDGSPNCPYVNGPLNAVKPSFVEALNFALDTAILNSKCREAAPTNKKGQKKPVPRRLDDVWNNDGWVYPAKWQNMIQNMAQSTNDNNRVLGFFGEVFVSPAMMGIVDSFDKYYLYQIFAMSATDELPKKCCDAFLNDQMLLRQKIAAEVEAAITNYKNAKLGCPGGL